MRLFLVPRSWLAILWHLAASGGRYVDFNCRRRWITSTSTTAALGGRLQASLPQHFLYFLPEPQGQVSLRLTLSVGRRLGRLILIC